MGALLPSLPQESASVVHLGMFVCMSVCPRVYSKTIAPIDYICLHQKVYPWLCPPKMIQNGSGSGLNNLLNDSSPFRDGTKHDIKVRRGVKRALW